MGQGGSKHLPDILLVEGFDQLMFVVEFKYTSIWYYKLYSEERGILSSVKE